MGYRAEYVDPDDEYLTITELEIEGRIYCVYDYELKIDEGIGICTRCHSKKKVITYQAGTARFFNSRDREISKSSPLYHRLLRKLNEKIIELEIGFRLCGACMKELYPKSHLDEWSNIQ